MDGLAQSVVDELEPRARERGIRLLRGTGLPSARGQQQSLREALVHLVDNAIKFMPPRGDAVVEVGYDPEVRTPEGRQGAFFVRDNGAGIAPLYHERVFQLFHRGPHTAADTAGTGVGLAIVKRIINAHGGSVWLESTPGEGACFCFSLALANSPSAAALGGSRGMARPEHPPESRAA